MHLGTHLVRSSDLPLLARRLGVTALLAAGAVAVAGPAPGVRTPSTAPPSEALGRRATGRIEGMVEISTTLTARRPDFRIYADPGSGASPPPAAPRDPIAAELRNVVLYLEGDSARLWSAWQSSETRMRTTMAQRDERFVPHVRPVVQGATVDFPNDDNVFHNVFSLSAAASPNGRGFDLGRYPKGSSRSVTFAKPGIVQVFCHIHQDMSATVFVLANPYFASPGEDHRFVIDDVPEGDYTIVAWHERITPIKRHVHVVAGQTTPIDFNIPLPQGGSGGR
jgi:plastocyanin